MISSNNICLGKCGTSGSTDVLYVRPAVRCTIDDLLATSLHVTDAQSATLVISDPSGNTVGTATFASDAAAGSKATYAKNATYGESIFGPDESTNTYFYITVSDETADDYVLPQVIIDPSARQAKDFS